MDIQFYRRGRNSAPDDGTAPKVYREPHDKRVWKPLRRNVFKEKSLKKDCKGRGVIVCAHMKLEQRTSGV